MGLLNWWKERRFRELAFEIKQLNQLHELLDQRVEILSTKVNSLHSQIAKRKIDRKGSNSSPSDDAEDGMTPEMRAFYESTVEYQSMQKYKNNENNN